MARPVDVTLILVLKLCAFRDVLLMYVEHLGKNAFRNSTKHSARSVIIPVDMFSVHDA